MITLNLNLFLTYVDKNKQKYLALNSRSASGGMLNSIAKCKGWKVKRIDRLAADSQEDLWKLSEAIREPRTQWSRRLTAIDR